MAHLLQEGSAHLEVFYLDRILKEREMGRSIHTLDAIQIVISKCVAEGQRSNLLSRQSQVQFLTRSQAAFKEVM